jgi:hypothetical protein
MVFLFWLLWSIDLLAAVFVLMASDFRQSFGAGTGLQGWLLLVLALAVVGGPVLRFGFKLRGWSLGVVALPLLVGFLWYLIDRGRGRV